MNRDDIIRFGEQADEVADRKIKMRGEFHPEWHEVRDEAFAKLVVAAEREACALVVENCCSYCAERIRERDGKPREPVQCNISIEDVTKIALKIFEAEFAKQGLKP
jgi:hypothetical protein